jgi:hypothetical protein
MEQWFQQRPQRLQRRLLHLRRRHRLLFRLKSRPWKKKEREESANEEVMMEGRAKNVEWKGDAKGA